MRVAVQTLECIKYSMMGLFIVVDIQYSDFFIVCFRH